MGLERIHSYLVVRLLRVVVPLLILGAAGLFAWNYMESPGGSSDDEPATVLDENMAALTEGVTYTQGEGGRTSFTVSAGRNRGYAGGINQLEEAVEIVVRGDGENPDRRIRGRECGVNQEEGRVECEGGIEIDLDAQTVARTERVAYDDASGTASTLAPVEIVRPGQFDVRADRMHVQFHERLVHLEGNVHAQRADGSRLDAQEVWYSEETHRVTASGGIRLLSLSFDLSADRAEGILSPAATLSAVSIRGRVNVRSLDVENPGSMTSRELDVDLSQGQLQHMHASGNVVVETPEADGTETLSADTIDSVFDPGGALQSIESEGNARVVFSSGGTIRADSIRQPKQGTIETGADSKLDLNSVTVEGSNFLIEQDEGAFRTEYPALISMSAGTLRGDRTLAFLDSESGEFSRLEQEGSVQFQLDGREGTAQTARVDDLWIAFDGNVNITDPEYTLEASSVRFHRTNGSLEADGHVFLLTRVEDERLLVTSETLRGGRDNAMRFEGNATLRRGGTEVAAEQIDVDTHGRAFTAERGVTSTMDGMTVRADSLVFDDAIGRVEYSGSVEGRTGEMTMASRKLVVTMVGQEIERIDATGSVDVRSLEGMQGRGEQAVYLRSANTVTLTGRGAQARDPASGICSGDEIVVDVRTHDVSVHGHDGPAACSPYTDPQSSTFN